MQIIHGMYVYNGFVAINLSLHSSYKVYTCLIQYVFFNLSDLSGKKG